MRYSDGPPEHSQRVCARHVWHMALWCLGTPISLSALVSASTCAYITFCMVVVLQWRELLLDAAEHEYISSLSPSTFSHLIVSCLWAVAVAVCGHHPQHNHAFMPIINTVPTTHKKSPRHFRTASRSRGLHDWEHLERHSCSAATPAGSLRQWSMASE
jgi:hypothetical protein